MIDGGESAERSAAPAGDAVAEAPSPTMSDAERTLHNIQRYGEIVADIGKTTDPERLTQLVTELTDLTAGGSRDHVGPDVWGAAAHTNALMVINNLNRSTSPLGWAKDQVTGFVGRFKRQPSSLAAEFAVVNRAGSPSLEPSAPPPVTPPPIR